jgi:oxygen-independent coproporphyrinogen-3 oxidase
MTQVLSLYVHVPFCVHLCNYCDFYKRKLESGRKQFEDFHRLLELSTERHSALLRENGFELGEWETVYLGGGTPSLWGKEGAPFFKKLLLKNGIKTDSEFTMEIDPGTWDHALLKAWKEIGLNRISIGTQTLDPNFLKIMDRIHTLDESLNFLSLLQKENWNYSLDFLLGIPYSKENKRDIQRELDLFLSFSPHHVSLYILNARSKYPHIQAMPDDEYIREEYLFVSEYLRKKGFHHYEVSNFALPGFESKHNRKYWRGESVAALGPTGTGYLAIASEKALRYKWKVSSPEVEIEVLGKDELSLEETYLRLRTSDGWTPRHPSAELLALFKRWEELRFGLFTGGTMRLNSLGFLMLDSLMDDLFRLPPDSKQSSLVKSKT